jgi:hypothetical protein
MSFHDHHCVCGSRRKPADALLCGTCLAVAAPTDLSTYDNGHNRPERRRAAAIRLLARARRRRRP